MRIPSFRYMGGKARLRNWLVGFFPPSGRLYVEPFAGLGNVFYLARSLLIYTGWYLIDLDVSFFQAIRTANIAQIPDTVLDEEFEKYKTLASMGDSISRLLEPRISFGGKGYKYGRNTLSNSNHKYNGERYRETCLLARESLRKAVVLSKSWDQINWKELSKKDFVYLDPPYYGVKASYPNIDHEQLVRVLNGLECKWALSGYSNPIYTRYLQFKEVYAISRNSEIKSSSKREYSRVKECLWLNYYLNEVKP